MKRRKKERTLTGRTIAKKTTKRSLRCSTCGKFLLDHNGPNTPGACNPNASITEIDHDRKDD
jgi:hypothetical protein